MTSVSIIVPSYNQGHLIAHTLDSILSQEVANLDVFVADGGSKDATVAVLERYDKRIKWVSERDRGQTDAINKGLRQARGDIVAYINSDDTYEPGAIRRALELLDANPGVDFVYGDANLIDESGELIEHTHAVDFDIGVLTYDHNFICQPASFWRRSLVQRIGPFDESLQYLMDYEWFLRAAHAGARFLHAREPWANLRLHSACKTVMGSTTPGHDLARVRREILSRYRRRFGPAWLTSGVHRALKVAYRGKKLTKDLLENGALPQSSMRQRMQRGNAS